MPQLDEDAPLTPEASLQLIAEQRRTAHRRLDVDPVVLFGPWGVAWLLGYGLLFLRYGPDDRELLAMPAWLPFVVLAILLGAAGVVTAVAIARATRGVAGASAERGTMYVWSWFVAFTGYGMITPRFEDVLPADEFGLLMSALPVFITGILYMGGGAIWLDRDQFRLGVWLSAVNVAGVLAGPGWHSLVVAVLGGGAMTVAAIAIRRARGERAPSPGGVAP